MKPSQLYISMLAAASVAVTGTIQAQSSSSERRSSSQPMGAVGEVQRVSKDSVENRLTAKDLIGAGVYDLAGEKIGDIADIDLQGAVPATLASSFQAREQGDAAPRTYTGPNRADRQPGRTSSAEERSDRQAGRGMSGMEDATIYISVGGLWGIGDDLVSVPASELSYNAAEERFQLSANKADVVALAEQKTSEYAERRQLSETAAGKQSFADEATRVQEALESDPSTSAFASKVRVTTDGESLELQGTVDNKEQQKQIIDAARRATSLEIEDNLEVR